MNSELHYNETLQMNFRKGGGNQGGGSGSGGGSGTGGEGGSGK